jgi:predicted CopG family antitoxin
MRTMSITIDEQLYRTLKKTAGPRAMSRFIGEAVREKLRASRGRLYQEYRLANEDRDRNEALEDWEALETEGWR